MTEYINNIFIFTYFILYFMFLICITIFGDDIQVEIRFELNSFLRIINYYQHILEVKYYRTIAEFVCKNLIHSVVDYELKLKTDTARTQGKQQTIEMTVLLMILRKTR